MATVLETITDAMRDIGAVALEETPTAAEIQFGLRKLNKLTSTWNTENLMVYAVKQETFPIVGTQPSYTMGLGGDFDTARPDRIVYINVVDVSGNEYGVRLVKWDEFETIRAKYVTSPIPQVAYVSYDMPLAVIQMWPIADDASYNIQVGSWVQIPQFTTLPTNIILPSGYDRALQYNLSLELCPAYGREPSSALVSLAMDSKAQVKRINTTILSMGIDAALTKGGAGTNWQSQLFGGTN